MTRYTQAIIVFGLALPMAGLALLTGLVFEGRKRIKSEASAKALAYENHIETARETGLIEDWLAGEGRRERLAEAEALLDEEYIIGLTRNLEEICNGFSEIELTRTELSRPSGSSPVAGATRNRHARIKLSFEGGWGPLQQTLAQLEVRMPHLVLESLQIKPVRNPQTQYGAVLQLDVTYLCWQNPQ